MGTAQVVINVTVISGACVPDLITPGSGAVLDNGCIEKTDSIAWDFDWADCPGATHYHLFVQEPSKQTSIIDNANITTSSFHFYSTSVYIKDADRFGWKWKVRAKINGVWGAWSSERTFDVEPVNTDCL
jgi:hypothetical protein